MRRREGREREREGKEGGKLREGEMERRKEERKRINRRERRKRERKKYIYNGGQHFTQLVSTCQQSSSKLVSKSVSQSKK